MDVPSISRVRPVLLALGLFSALLAGGGLRLAWVEDMEYKRDERLIVQHVQEARATNSWPWLGDVSSVNVRQPGMSLWGFVAIGNILGRDDPLSLARGVQVANIAALMLLLAFVLWAVPPEEREPWLWAVALVAVNPIAVLYHRKIWNPSLFPLLTLLFLLGWWHRERRWGAVLFGFVGACLGQVQMAGFFFAAGFVAWAALFDRQRTHWVSWFAGSTLGALPLVPWLYYSASGGGGKALHAVGWTRWFTGHYFSRWVANPLGLTVQFSLEGAFRDFLRYPFVGGQPTYLVAVVHAVVLLLGAIMIVRAVGRNWRQRPTLAGLIGKGSPTAFTIAAALWGYGLLLTASGLPVHRHYLIVLFPLGFVWLARMALGPTGRSAGVGRGLLLTLCVAQCLIATSILAYVHEKQALIRGGDYGIPYGAQIQIQTAPITRKTA